MLRTFVNAWRTPDLRRKIIFTLIIVLLYRIGSSIPVPYVTSGISEGLSEYGTIFDYLNLFSGSGLEQATLFALGVSPYITAQIVIQLLTIAIPALEKLSKDGDTGRKKIDKITRYVSIGLSAVTAYGYYALLKANGLIVEDAGTFGAIIMIACYCAGASLVMWLCERIDERGIGNGVSIVLFVNIISGVRSMVQELINQFSSGDVAKIICAVLSIFIFLIVILLIVFVTNSERRIPVQYAKRVVGRKMYGGQSSNLPLKLNMSGVMPIIFASSITALPQTIAAFTGTNGSIADNATFWQKLVYILTPQSHIVGVILFLILIFAFAYFYISISFNTVEVANNLKKNGGFVPGIRPGKPTADYVKKVLNKITLVGAVFLAVIAGFPLIVSLFGQGYFSATLALSGSSLLIVVGVALETAHELESQLSMRHYKGFLE